MTHVDVMDLTSIDVSVLHFNSGSSMTHAGFWRCEQDALLASFQETICRLEDRLSQTSRDIYSMLQSSLSLGGQGRSGVALLQSKGSDTGLLAFGLARQMLESGR